MRASRIIPLLCGLVTAGMLASCSPGEPAHRSRPAGSAAPSSAAASGPGRPAGAGTPPPSRTPGPVASRPRSRTDGPATRTLATMSEPQRVGQLFLVGTPAVRPSRVTLAQIRRYHVGNVLLTGRSHRGVAATARVVATLQSRVTRAATAGVRLLVATDQEGGAVQVLSGPGFSRIPSAVEQGRWSPHRLRARAQRWGRQLRRAGVSVDLAPVLDTVSGPRAARHNAPIGVYGREYGYTPGAVARHGVAFARGLARSGVVPTAKHFPGLGRVRQNTDFASGVTDRTTTRNDRFLVPFQRAVRAGVPLVMVSTAYYQRLDPARPAAFSPFVIRRMLRGDLGFRGVVVSDDLGRAAQVSRWSYGRRAVRFLAAGGDLVLVAAPSALPAMYHAVLRRARTHPAFRRKVAHAALRVLRLKRQHGLAGR